MGNVPEDGFGIVAFNSWLEPKVDLASVQQAWTKLQSQGDSMSTSGVYANNGLSGQPQAPRIREFIYERNCWLVEFSSGTLLEIDEYRGRGNVTSGEISKAAKAITQLQEILERVQKEPLILQRIFKISKDKKYCFIKKGELEIRIQACPNLVIGDEVLLHPKTFQIVEHLGRPPLEISRFVPREVTNVSWEDIGGLEQAKADLREAIELPFKNKDLFKYYGRPGIKGILLKGPPGCGKTMLGKACSKSLAQLHDKEAALTGFLYVKGPEILDKYVGASEATVRDLFFDARRHKEEHGYPAVIFIDEADAILMARGHGGISSLSQTIVPMFLTEMDGLEESGAIVIIATNRPEVLDPAIVRDGRIDRKIQVERPNEKHAGDILRLNLKDVPFRKGGDRGEIMEAMIEGTLAAIYSVDARIGAGLHLRDVVNGAMLANCVNLAVSFAMMRDMGAGSTIPLGAGIDIEDMKNAVERIRIGSVGIQHNLV